MSLLKWDKAFAMEQAADDAELLEELLDIFKDSFRDDLKVIASGVSEQVPEQVRGGAHSIKGAAASLGIEGIRDLALAIEEGARQGDLTVAEQNMEVLQEMLKELETM